MSRCPITRVAAGKAGHPPCRRRLSCRKKGHLSRRERDTRSFRWSGPAQVCIPGQVTLVPLLATVLEPSLVFESRFEPSHRATIVNTGRWHHVNDPQKRNGISCGRRGGITARVDSGATLLRNDSSKGRLRGFGGRCRWLLSMRSPPTGVDFFLFFWGEVRMVWSFLFNYCYYFFFSIYFLSLESVSRVLVQGFEM